MAITTEIIKPAVPVRCTPQAPLDAIKQVEYGIEEEGVPSRRETASGDAVALAFEASKASRFEVAIALDAKQVVLHYSKFKADQPLFVIPTRAGDDMLRAIGADAARIVKRLPLKMLDRR